MRALALTLISAAIALGPWSVPVSQAAALTSIGGIAPGHHVYIIRGRTPRAINDVKWSPAGAGPASRDLNQLNLNMIKPAPNPATDTFNASVEVNATQAS